MKVKKAKYSKHPTCICFCGCVVCVATGSVLSRVPRVWLLTTEVIIYSIYKRMYVQNRKICGGKKQKTKKKQSDREKGVKVSGKDGYIAKLGPYADYKQTGTNCNIPCNSITPICRPHIPG